MGFGGEAGIGLRATSPLTLTLSREGRGDTCVHVRQAHHERRVISTPPNPIPLLTSPLKGEGPRKSEGSGRMRPHPTHERSEHFSF